jgi:hypothetical protein
MKRETSKVMSLTEEMEKLGVQKNIETHNEVLLCYSLNNDLTGMVNYFTKCQKMGAVDATSFHHVMDAFGGYIQ